MSSTYLFIDMDDAMKLYKEKMKRWKRLGYKMVRNNDFDAPDLSHFCAESSYPMIHYFENEPVY